MYQPFNNISIKVFGSSHADRLGLELEGIPSGEKIDLEKLQAFVDRRKSAKNAWSTPRIEPDEVIVDSGIVNGATNGKCIVASIVNTNRRSGDYSPYRDTPRPSHADYTAIIKDGDKVDLAGGGRFSGRMTSMLCIAGGIAKQILEKRDISVGAYVSNIGGVQGASYENKNITMQDIEKAYCNSPCAISKCKEMTKVVMDARKVGDSVGGQVECIVYNAPKGLGDNLFGGIEGRVSTALFGIPACKAVESGIGTKLAGMKGTKANDPFEIKNGVIKTKTNNDGGINGGISNGMPITFRATFKPTPSISAQQKTVNLKTMRNTTIQINGRHDACIVPRAVPVVEAVVALAVLDLMIESDKI